MPIDPADDPQFSLLEAGTAADEDARPAPDAKYSSFVAFVDESGDRGMQTLDPAYPIFLLSFCVFYKRYYSEKVFPALHKFKFNHFGHDLVVLHEHEIRKEKGAFKFSGRAAKERFLKELRSDRTKQFHPDQLRG